MIEGMEENASLGYIVNNDGVGNIEDVVKFDLRTSNLKKSCEPETEKKSDPCRIGGRRHLNVSGANGWLK